MQSKWELSARYGHVPGVDMCSMDDTQDDVALLQLQPLQEMTLCMTDKLAQKLNIYVSWNRKITISHRVEA